LGNDNLPGYRGNHRHYWFWFARLDGGWNWRLRRPCHNQGGLSEMGEDFGCRMSNTDRFQFRMICRASRHTRSQCPSPPATTTS
jgi:hypothetical protein